jgi:hypothetical protein
VDALDAKRVVDLIVVIEYCRHGAGQDAQADRAEEYARALGVDEPFLVVARDALQAMLVSATGFAHHFSGLIASLSLFETGTFDIDDITPKTAVLDRPGAAVELSEAFRRGPACTGDFSALAHLARVDEPLDEVRRECGIPSRA